MSVENKDIVFTIITPSLGRETLKETIRSIEIQTYAHWQHIIIFDEFVRDNNATWKVPEDVISVDRDFIYKKVSKDTCTEFIYLKDRYNDYGNTPRHLAYNRIKGDFVLYMDDDDLYTTKNAFMMLSERLNRMKHELGVYPEFAVFPAFRKGERFFNWPPEKFQTVSNQFLHAPIIDGVEMKWPVSDSYTADGDMIEKLKKYAVPVKFDFSTELVRVDNMSEGKYETKPIP